MKQTTTFNTAPTNKSGIFTTTIHTKQEEDSTKK